MFANPSVTELLLRMIVAIMVGDVKEISRPLLSSDIDTEMVDSASSCDYAVTSTPAMKCGGEKEKQNPARRTGLNKKDDFA